MSFQKIFQFFSFIFYALRQSHDHTEDSAHHYKVMIIQINIFQKE